MRTMIRTMVAVALLGSAGLAHSIGACGRWGCGQNSPVVAAAEVGAWCEARFRVISSPCSKWGCGEDAPGVDAAGRTAGSSDASSCKAASPRVRAR